MENSTEDPEVVNAELLVAEVSQEQAAPHWLWDYYTQYAPVLAVFVIAMFIVMAPISVGAQSSTLDIDPDSVRGGIFDGANLILGAGILGIIMLPAGIKFGLNLISDIVGAFSNIRVGR